MDENIFDKVQDIDLKKTMEVSYINYAMSVIASRALPDVRDGLKPVQRRVLYSMIELNNGPDKPHRKCARIVGDTMGKYHPHGDSSIYGALVNMAREWTMRYTLVDGHGNFGSVDGDGAAAMRYTEARLSKIAMEMLSDINKDTVVFEPNFDDTEKEPTVLPSRFPNLLVNGTTGIAVGMATNIPPHNLGEVIDAVIKMIDNKVNEGRDTQVEEILDIIKGPDFPTGASILGKRGIEEAYRTGKGKIKVRAVTDIETLPNGKSRIIVTELPYMVNKAKLIEKIAELVRDKRIDGITDLRDESDREGMRICIELRKDVNANVVLNLLLKHTQLQDSFGVIMLALVNNEPKILNICDMLKYYLLHQEDVVRRRTQFDLNKAQERAHIVEGLLTALDHIDRVITIIRGSKTVQIAKASLCEEFGLSDAQAQAIVDMRLRALTGLAREDLQNEYAELEVKIAEYKEILANENKLLGVIRDEISIIRDKYADPRRTQILFDAEEFSAEDLIPMEDTIIAMTKLGYIKRMSLDNFRNQNRGGKGIKGMNTIDEDYIEDILMTSTHHHILFFTNLGRVYRLKVYEIPEASRTARGTAIVNLLQLMPGEKVSAIVTLREFEEDMSLFMATKLGLVKKTRLEEFQHIRKTGIMGITLREGDELIEVKKMKPGVDFLLVTKFGQCIRFNEENVRATSRSSMGVRGINLKGDDEVVAMQMSTQGEYLLVASEFGMGKKTRLELFPTQNRGGKGILCYRINEKTGNLIGAKAVNDDNEVMLITTEGIIIRISVSEISTVSRVASGVKLMNINPEKNESVAGIAKVREKNNESDDVDFSEDVEPSEATAGTSSEDDYRNMQRLLEAAIEDEEFEDSDDEFDENEDEEDKDE